MEQAAPVVQLASPGECTPMARYSLLGCAALLLQASVAAAQTVAIRNVTVIAATGDPPLRNANVVISGSTIASVSIGGPPPRAARLIDGTGKFLIPGLFDLHVHVSKTRASALGLFVANGVTTVRDLGGDHQELLRWRREVRAGTRTGPRLLLAGPFLESERNVRRQRDTPPDSMAEPVERTRVPVGSPERARHVVDSLAALEVDHLKIRTVEDRATYLAIARASRDRRLMLTGHVAGLPPALVLEAGQRDLEHFFYPNAALDSLSPDRRVALWRRFAAQNVGVVPTLVTVPRSVLVPDSIIAAAIGDSLEQVDPRGRYLSRFLRIDWAEQALEQTPERREAFRALEDRTHRDLKEMRQAGVRLMAGSDVAVLNIYPGWGLHDELELFVSTLGMPPMEALERATRIPAEFLGLADSLGTIEAGKVADLVLLRSDPTRDIRNTQRIESVFLRGRLYDRAALDQLLADVEGAEDRRVNDWPRRR